MGESSTLTAPPGMNYIIATWMPDGKQILVVASAAGHTPITYLQDISSGTARQITREGRYAVFTHDVAMSVSPDGQYCLTTDGGNHYWIQPIGDGEPSEIKGLTEGDFPIEWHNNSQNIFLERRGSLGAIDIYDLNLTNWPAKALDPLLADGQNRDGYHASRTHYPGRRPLALRRPANLLNPVRRQKYPLNMKVWAIAGHSDQTVPTMG